MPAMQPLPHTHSCFVCGEANPIGLRLKFETDGRLVRARFCPRPEHIGFRHTVHGGILATLLDEIMVWACAVPTRRFAYCAEFNIRYLKPARPLETITATAELTANRRNKLFEARGELRDAQDTVLASATGKYLPIREAEASEMLADLIGDMAAFRSKID